MGPLYTTATDKLLSNTFHSRVQKLPQCVVTTVGSFNKVGLSKASEVMINLSSFKGLGEGPTVTGDGAALLHSH